MIKQLIIVAALLIALSHQNVTPYIGKPIGRNPSRMTFNLDLPPETRWNEIGKAYAVPLQQAVAEIGYLIDLIPMSRVFLELFGFWAKTMCKYQEMVREVQGLSKAAYVDFNKLMFMNYVYEISTLCSGVIVRNNQGQILHGRNMDFDFMSRFSPLVSEVDVYRAGKYVATADFVVGGVMVLTGIKPGAFAINEDTRSLAFDKQTKYDLLKNIFLHQYVPSAWLLREVLFEENDWASARNRLMTTNTTSPIYYIISGVKGNEGSVIEKSAIGYHAVYDLNETTWFLVQTNYDRNVPDPDSDRRRTPAERRIEQIGQGMTIQQLYEQVMTVYPSFNIATILTMSAIASTGYHNVTTWYGIWNTTTNTFER